METNGTTPKQPGNGTAPVWTASAPRNLMVPWILLLIKQWSAHGYLLLTTLRQMGFTTIDHATLYKELRNLEKQGLVSSSWGTDGSGPAKRIYAITATGEELLKAGADAMTAYQRMFSNFFDSYARVTGWTPPSGPATTSQAPVAKGTPTSARKSAKKTGPRPQRSI